MQLITICGARNALVTTPIPVSVTGKITVAATDTRSSPATKIANGESEVI